MRSIQRTIFFTLLIVSFFVFVTGCSNNSPKQYAKYVVVIGVDGMSPDGILNATTPNIDKLVKNGCTTFHGRAVRPTSSTSNWGSMLMGAAPMHHGLTSNSWERDNYLIEPADTGLGVIFPTIYSIIKSQKPEMKTAAVYDWSGFGRLFEKNAVDYDFDTPGPVKTTDQAVELIKNQKPNFMFIHLDHVDGAGHHYGHGTKEYYQSVELADSLIGLVYDALTDNKMIKNAVIMVTADHGGINYGHGGDTMEEMEIPFIISGGPIRKNKELSATFYTYDNPATAAFSLGCEIPQSWVGRPVEFAFTEADEELKIKYTRPFVYEPVVNPKNGLFIGEYPLLTIKSKTDGGVIRYTADGSEPTSESTQYKEPVEIKSSAVIKSAVFEDGIKSKSITRKYRTLKKENGLSYKYYEGNWEKLPNFTKLRANKSGKAYLLNLDEVKDKREDNYAIVFETKLVLENTGKYEFSTVSDDGTKLYINGQLVVDNDGSHGAQKRSGEVNITTNEVKLRVEYFEHYSGEYLKVLYKAPGMEETELPAENMYSK